MKKILIALFMILITFSMAGCSNNFVFPEESDFLLSTKVSSETLLKGEELKVVAIVKNSSNNGYTLNSSATFSQSGLIHINIYEINEPELVLVGASRFVEISAGQEIIEERIHKMDKVGKFKVIILSSFEITDPKTNEQKKYLLREDLVIIEVKE